MAEEKEHDRIVLLNTMLSYSTSRAPGDAPPIGAAESIKLLDARRKKGWAIEFPGLDDKKWHRGKDEERDEEEQEKARMKAGEGLDAVRIRAVRFEEAEDYTYATVLVEALDSTARSFAVVNIENFEGREIAADPKERGSAAAHIVVRIPNENAHDLGKYRCAIETVHPITRTEIEHLFNRQLRRYAEANEITFPMTVHKGKKPESKNYRFTPRLELSADVGRKLSFSSDKTLSHMVFTKRAEKQSIGKGTIVTHQEIIAEVEHKVRASQGPAEPGAQKTWSEQWADWYRGQGFEVRFYFRHANGRVEGGSLHKAIAGATDLLMCPRAQIVLKKAPKKWVSSINTEIATALKELLDTDGLWVRK